MICHKLEHEALFALIQQNKGVITWEQGCDIVETYKPFKTIDVKHGFMHKLVVGEHLIVLFVSSIGDCAIMLISEVTPRLSTEMTRPVALVA